MRKNIVAGNWKMNPDKSDKDLLVSDLNDKVNSSETDVYIFPPSIYLDELAGKMKDITVGAQNFFYEGNGAFTGEVSLSMLKSIGIDTVLVGHSERREVLGEDQPLLQNKVKAALDAGFTVFYCCGEPLEVRESDRHFDYVLNQINSELIPVIGENSDKVVIAYEPIWAIGTGKTATSEQAQEMHAEIRRLLSNKLGESGNSISILYGGSCKPENAQEIFGKNDVDGGLIGGASLKAESFNAICNSFE